MFLFIYLALKVYKKICICKALIDEKKYKYEAFILCTTLFQYELFDMTSITFSNTNGFWGYFKSHIFAFCNFYSEGKVFFHNPAAQTYSRQMWRVLWHTPVISEIVMLVIWNSGCQCYSWVQYKYIIAKTIFLSKL